MRRLFEAMAATLAGFGMPTTIAGLYQEMTGAMLRGHIAFDGGHRRLQGKGDGLGGDDAGAADRCEIGGSRGGLG